MDVLIVRRGLTAVYYSLVAAFASSRDLQIVVDRREHERRQQPRPVGEDRRGADRRRHPPTTWELADFVAVPEAPSEPSEVPHEQA